MAAVLLIFLLALGLAVALGWSADTRDGADWKENPAVFDTARHDGHAVEVGAERSEIKC